MGEAHGIAMLGKGMCNDHSQLTLGHDYIHMLETAAGTTGRAELNNWTVVISMFSITI